MLIARRITGRFAMRRDGNQNQKQRREQDQALARRESGQQLTRDPFEMMVRDPWRLMREMMMNPFAAFQQLAPWGDGGGGELGWSPSFEVRETDDAFLIKGDMPGIKQDDLDINLVGNNLQVRGTREREQEQDEGTWHTYERSYGQFLRSFPLPDSADVDKVTCDLKDGVLTVVVPKQAGSAPQRRKIQIGSGQKS
jgi:HSP20 family protein